MHKHKQDKQTFLCSDCYHIAVPAFDDSDGLVVLWQCSRCQLYGLTNDFLQVGTGDDNTKATNKDN